MKIGRCNIARVRFKIVWIGMILQILLFSMYMATIHSQHDTQTNAQIMPIGHFTQDAFNPSIVRKSDATSGKTGLKVEKTLSSCTGLGFPGHLMRKQEWQSIDPARTGFVFSAYYGRNELRVLGATSARLGPVSCQLWYLNTTTSIMEMVVSACSVTGLPEGHGKRFTAAYFNCKLPGDRKYIPHAVSVVKENCGFPSNLLSVTVTKDKGEKPKFKYSLCVTPFNFRYGRAYELIEWIELNRLLGADHFVFYNYSIASNVEQVLQNYLKQDDLIEVVDWKLPMGAATWPPVKGREEIHYFGQIASLNECLLRTRGRSEYLVNIDVDEFIIPRKKDVKTWDDMLSNPTGGGYLIANVFFRKEWNTSRSNFTGFEIAKQYKLVTLLKLQHEKNVFNYKTRSKYIVNPFLVDVLGIHFIWKWTGGIKLTNVPHDVALLHHYRNWMKYEEKQDRIDDDTIVDNFKDSLIDNVVTRWKELPGVDLDTPLCDHQKEFGGC